MMKNDKTEIENEFLYLRSVGCAQYITLFNVPCALALFFEF